MKIKSTKIFFLKEYGFLHYGSLDVVGFFQHENVCDEGSSKPIEGIKQYWICL